MTHCLSLIQVSHTADEIAVCECLVAYLRSCLGDDDVSAQPMKLRRQKFLLSLSDSGSMQSSRLVWIGLESLAVQLAFWELMILYRDESEGPDIVFEELLGSLSIPDKQVRSLINRNADFRIIIESEQSELMDCLKNFSALYKPFETLVNKLLTNTNSTVWNSSYISEEIHTHFPLLFIATDSADLKRLLISLAVARGAWSCFVPGLNSSVRHNSQAYTTLPYTYHF